MDIVPTHLKGVTACIYSSGHVHLSLRSITFHLHVRDLKVFGFEVPTFDAHHILSMKNSPYDAIEENQPTSLTTGR
jgi:hypothetical protein